MGGGRICCVPLCPSKSGNLGITFHEIPSDNEVREKWLKVISRADNRNPNKSWIPGSRSAACSIHFVENDYLQHHKQKRLKKDAVPSVFPDYPSHKVPSVKSVRKSPTKRETIATIPRKRAKTQLPSEDVRDYTEEPCDDNIPESKSLIGTQDPAKTRSFYYKKRINNLLCAIRRKDKIILDLMTQIEALKPKPCPLQASLNKLKSAADSGEVKALLLLQQIEAYGKTRFRWSELCIRMCVLWRSKSRKAYNFARNKFINLPCFTTLQNYIGPSCLETGLTQLARLRLQEELSNAAKSNYLCSLIFDEMSLSPKLQYVRQADKIIGKAEYGRGATSSSSNGLANRLLCFVLKGLSTNYRITT